MRLLVLALALLATLLPITPAAAQTCDELALGTLLQCTIVASDEVDAYPVALNAGDVLLVRAGRLSQTIDPAIELRSPTDALLCSAQASNGFAEISRCVAETTGQYTLTVRSRTASGTGAYSLWAQRLNLPPAPDLAIGTPTLGELSIAADADLFRFTATQSDTLLLRSGTMSSLNLTLRVVDAEGTLVCSGQTSSAVQGYRCTIATTGEHTLIVTDRSLFTGGYAVQVQRLNDPVGATLMRYDSIADGALLLPGEMDTYQFDGAAGETVFLQSTRLSGPLHSGIALYRQTGAPVCENRISSAANALTCLLPATERYTLVLFDSTYVQASSYRLALQRVGTPVGATPLPLGIPRTAVIEPAGRLWSATIAVTSSDLLLIRAGRQQGSSDLSGVLYSAEGVVICTDTTYSFSSRPAIFFPCRVPTAGTYHLLLRTTDALTADLGLHADSMLRPASAQPIRYGLTRSAAITTTAQVGFFAFTANAGATIEATMQRLAGATIQPQIEIISPEGTVLCQRSAPFSASVSTGSCLLPSTGIYHILTSSSTSPTTGDYTVALRCLDAAPCGPAGSEARRVALPLVR